MSGVVSGNVVPLVAVPEPRQVFARRGPSTYCVEAPAETVKPKFLFTGTIHENSKPGRTFHVGVRWRLGPSVRPSMVLSRAAR